MKCSGCHQRKECDYPVGGGKRICDKCARDFGMSGGKIRNQAEANSRTWKAKPCKHQSVDRNNYRRNGRNWQRAICQRCKVTVWDIVV